MDPVARMKALTASLVSASGSPASLEAADADALVTTLGELQDHVEDVDCACDLSKIGGLPPLLALLRGPHAGVRAAAAEVLAVCAQNNAKAQAQLLEGGVMAPLLGAARSDPDETARQKALFALSSASWALSIRPRRSRPPQASSATSRPQRRLSDWATASASSSPPPPPASPSSPAGP